MHGCAKLVHAQKGHTSLVIRWKGGDLGCEGVEDGLLTFQCQLLLRVLPAEENWQARDEERPSSLNGGREEPNFWEGREVVINRAREVEIQLSSQRHLFPVSAEGSGSGRRRGKHRLKTSRFVAGVKRSGPKQVSERGHKPSARDGAVYEPWHAEEGTAYECSRRNLFKRAEASAAQPPWQMKATASECIYCLCIYHCRRECSSRERGIDPTDVRAEFIWVIVLHVIVEPWLRTIDQQAHQ